MALGKFQTQVSKYPAKGVAGDKATLNPFVYTDRNYVAETVGAVPVTVGGFVWSSVANDTADITDQSGVYSAVAVQASASANMTSPLGIVQRNLSYRDYDIMDGGTLAVPGKAALNVVIFGDMYVVSTTVATAGQKVFASTTNGSISTGAAGGSVAGSVETDWTVTDGGAIGDLITVTSWGKK